MEKNWQYFFLQELCLSISRNVFLGKQPTLWSTVFFTVLFITEKLKTS